MPELGAFPSGWISPDLVFRSLNVALCRIFPNHSTLYVERQKAMSRHSQSAEILWENVVSVVWTGHIMGNSAKHWSAQATALGSCKWSKASCNGSTTLQACIYLIFLVLIFVRMWEFCKRHKGPCTRACQYEKGLCDWKGEEGGWKEKRLNSALWADSSQLPATRSRGRGAREPAVIWHVTHPLPGQSQHSNLFPCTSLRYRSFRHPAHLL